MSGRKFIKAGTLIYLSSFSVFSQNYSSSNDYKYKNLMGEGYQQSPSLKFSGVYSHFDYSEPGLMSDVGDLYGAEISSHIAVSKNTELHIIGEFLNGKTLYKGGLSSWGSNQIIPYQAASDNSVYSLGIYLKRVLEVTDSIHVTPYSGVLVDGVRNMTQGLGSYAREIDHYSLPLGVEAQLNLFAKSSLSVFAQYQYFLTGTVISHFEDVQSQLSPIRNNQNSGLGYRSGVSFLQNFNDYGWGLSFSYVFWDIQQSDSTSMAALPKLRFYEPHNITKRWNAGLSFYF